MFPKPKKKKRSSPSALKNKFWAIFSEYIRRRDADEEGIASCISCGVRKSWKEFHAGHYVAKSLSLALRYHEKNVHNQCVACNLWRHGNPTSYAIALIKRYGETILSDLDEIRRTNEGMRYSPSEYEEMIESYKQKLEKLNN